jgi:hypothetical protein
MNMGMNDFFVRLKYAFTGDCGNACGMDSRYGFVPEADCAVHDAPRRGTTIASLDLIHGTDADVEKYEKTIGL